MKKYILGILALASLASCTERIDLNLNDDGNKRLVIDAMITDETTAHEVKISLTSSYFANEPAPQVTGAIVTITSDKGEVYPLIEKEPGLYLTANDVTGVIGNTYTLTIDYEGVTYKAISMMTRVAMIDSLGQKPAEYDYNNNGTEDDDYYVTLYAQEPAGIGDYYMWEGSVNGVKVTDTLSRLLFADDELIDGSYVDDVSLESFGVATGDTVDVSMLSISKQMNEFLIAAMLETEWRGGLFDGPPANLPSMFDNGAIGFFSASAVSKSSLIIK